MRDDMEMSLLGSDDRMGHAKPKKAKKQKHYSGPPEETDYQPFDWKKIVYSKRYIPLWILLVLLIVATVLISVYQDRVVDKLRPFSEKVRDIPAGWLIPIAILFVLSFPPLIGDEIVEILCGIIYGLWIGFGIVAAGTYIGQIGNWFLFKYALRRKAAKLERTNLNYGAMARMVRNGGLLLLCIIRLSAIPPHISTAVFSTCDVKFWHFLVSTFLSLPKQIFLVYLGTLIVREKKGNNTVQTVVFAVILVITVVMAVWLWRKMKAIKIELLEEQEQRRKAKNMAPGRDEEESSGGEWSSSMSGMRNNDFEPLYDPVPPPGYTAPPAPESAHQYGKDTVGPFHEQGGSRV